MAASDETTTSKLIEVLSRIDATLGTLDRRLQILEQSWPPAQAGATAPVAAAEANRVHLTEHDGFITKHKPDLEGLSQLQEIIVEENDLLALLLCISNPCLDRHQTRQTTNSGHKTFTYPFAELFSYRDILKLFVHESERPDSELRSLYSDPAAIQGLTPRLKIETADLLACCNEQCKPLVRDRDENIARGVVLFDDLPSLFSPGMLLVSLGGEGLEQVVEVSSCDMTTGQATSEACVVNVWHFRWDGRGFSRTSSHFELSRYSGTRPIKGFPYHPVIGLDPEQSITRLRGLVARNRKDLARLQELSNVQAGDYPLCELESEVSDGFSDWLEVVQVILDPAAFSLYNEEQPKTATTFGCYCSGCTSSISPDDVLRNARYVLLAPTKVEGFLIGAKKWSTFPIRDLRANKPLNWEEAGSFNATIYLSESVVEFLKQKLTEHFAWRRKILEGTNADRLPVFHDDISRKAFVVQFHGPEGAGKTESASSLANYCHRPALYLDPDEVGLEPEGFANKLSLYSKLSFRWGAVLVFSEADKMLQGRQLDGPLRNPLGEALAGTLESFSGAMIFLSGDLPTLDTELVRYIKRIPFPPPLPKDIGKIFVSHLDQLDPDFVESGDDMVVWVVTTAAKLRLSVRDIRNIFSRAVRHARRGDRKLTLSGIIKAYTTTTGRPDEWDLVDDSSLYGSQEAEGTTPPAVAELLRNAFGAWSELPDDGRLPLTVSKSFYYGAPPDSALEGARVLNEATEELQKVGGMWIVDWGWPSGTWYPIQGCAYTPNGLYRWVAPQMKHPRQEWELAGFTAGLREVLNSQEHDWFRCGGPWRRLVLVEGLSSISLDVLAQTTGALEEIPHRSVFSTYLPWFGYGDDNRRSSVASMVSLNRMAAAHVNATILESSRPVASIARLGPLGQPLDNTLEPDLEFHIAFFHMVEIRAGTGNTGELRNTTQFFGVPSIGLQKGCFTIFPAPSVDNSPPLVGPIHWTLICLTPEGFWSQDTYVTCAAPTLRAQTTHYVAEALRVVVNRWRKILQAIENLVDSDSVLRHPDQLQDILFDDDAFSTSKRYFWAINFIHEAVKLLDDSIQQWATFRRRSVTPWTTIGLYSDREYYWHEKSQEVLATADRQAEESCEDLKRLRQEFQEKLDRITIMRDGLFNASAVMESRASTQLGENVKLLTFVSIFFLPLGLCVAIWSINESYNRTDLAIVTVIVAVATYSLTFNLNNVVHGLQKVFAPKRRKLIEKMEKDRNLTWQWFGDRFKAFERSERGQQKPSEWIIWAYLIRRTWRAVLRKRDPAPDEMESGWSL